MMPDEEECDICGKIYEYALHHCEGACWVHFLGLEPHKHDWAWVSTKTGASHCGLCEDKECPGRMIDKGEVTGDILLFQDRNTE